MHIGIVIRRLREYRGIKREDFMHQIGLDSNMIIYIETGGRNTSIYTIQNAADVLNVPLAYLYILADDSHGDVLVDRFRKQIIKHLGLDEYFE